MEQCRVVAVYEYQEEVTCTESLERVEIPDELIGLDGVDAIVISVPNYLIKPYGHL
jgi:hypothetical protein